MRMIRTIGEELITFRQDLIWGVYTEHYDGQRRYEEGRGIRVSIHGRRFKDIITNIMCWGHNRGSRGFSVFLSLVFALRVCTMCRIMREWGGRFEIWWILCSAVGSNDV